MCGDGYGGVCVVRVVSVWGRGWWCVCGDGGECVVMWIVVDCGDGDGYSTIPPTGAGSVVPCMTTLVSEFGEGDEKGKIMGIFRSLGALARAFGPFAASAGE